jgi:hypothetical protein
VIGPETGRAAFRWALLIVLVAAGLLLVLRPGSAGFVITVFTLVIGLVFAGLVIVMNRLSSR